MQLGQHDLRGRHSFGRVHVYRDPATVVGDGDAVVDVDLDVDLVAVAGQRLVDGVVDDFEDQVVEPTLGGIADVHARAFAHGREALEHLDVAGRIASVTGFGCTFVSSGPVLAVGTEAEFTLSSVAMGECQIAGQVHKRGETPDAAALPTRPQGRLKPGEKFRKNRRRK